MNLHEFLQRREQLAKNNPIETRAMCYTCIRPQVACLCHLVQTTPTKTKTLILMHEKEARKEKTGTARVAALSLPHSEIMVGIDFTAHPRLNQLLEDPQFYPMLLYPGKEAKTLSAPEITTAFQSSITPLLILLDGTWPCARKMLRLSRNLQELPKVTLSQAHTSRFAIKAQPASQCLSTIEALYHFFVECQALGLEAQNNSIHCLPAILEHIVDFHIQCAKDPHRSGYRRAAYKSAEERKISKKYQKKGWK